MTNSSKVPRTVSATTLRDFLDCRRAGRMREFWQPYDFQEALVFGSAVHAGLEGFYLGHSSTDQISRGQAAIVKYFQDLITSLGHLASGSMDQINGMYGMCWNIYLNYVEFEKTSPLIPPGGKIIGVEKRLGVPVFKDVKFTGQIDLMFEDAQGRLFVVDHKTSGKGLNDSSLDVDEQLTAYAYLAWKTTGKVPEGVIYNVAMKAVPDQPIVLKDGTLSISKDQATSALLFREAIEKFGYLPKYDAYLKYLEVSGWSRFFQRMMSRRTEEELRHFESYLPGKVQDVYDALSGPWEKAYPAPSIYRCGYCSYLGPCKAMMAGEDWEAILDSKYKHS